MEGFFTELISSLNEISNMSKESKTYAPNIPPISGEQRVYSEPDASRVYDTPIVDEPYTSSIPGATRTYYAPNTPRVGTQRLPRVGVKNISYINGVPNTSPIPDEQRVYRVPGASIVYGTPIGDELNTSPIPGAPRRCCVPNTSFGAPIVYHAPDTFHIPDTFPIPGTPRRERISEENNINKNRRIKKLTDFYYKNIVNNIKLGQSFNDSLPLGISEKMIEDIKNIFINKFYREIFNINTEESDENLKEEYCRNLKREYDILKCENHHQNTPKTRENNFDIYQIL